MTTGTISYTQVMGSIGILARQKHKSQLANLGISEPDFRLLVGDVMWTFEEAYTVQAVIEALLNAGTRMVGIPKMVYPAEWVCAFGLMFVQPTNWDYYCRIMESQESGKRTIETMAQPSANVEYRPVRSDQLFAMMCRVESANSQDIDRFRRQFEDATELELARLQPDEGTPS